MKNLFISFILLVLIIGFSQKVSLAPEIGLNIIPMSESHIGQNYQFGYHFGGHLRYHFSKKFKLSSGVFLTQKKKEYASLTTSSALTQFDDLLSIAGGGLGIPGGTGSIGLDTLLDISGLNTNMTESIKGVSSELFIEIPLLANYKVKNINFYLGPYVAFLISANRKEEITTDIPILDIIDIDALLEESGFGSFGGFASSFLPSSGTESSSKPGTVGLRTFDMGINAGIGYEMNDLHFTFMYSHGLLDYRDDNKGDSKETLNLFRISIAYFFDIGKNSKQKSASFN